jgi:hypothetical protein
MEGDADSVCVGAVDYVLEHLVRLAGGAADQAHLFQIVLGLEQVALLRLPHPVVRPGHSMIGIGGERAFVPHFGVVIAPELAARVADQVRNVGIVVMIEGLQRGDRRFVVAFLVNKRIGRLVSRDEVFKRAASIFLDV